MLTENNLIENNDENTITEEDRDQLATALAELESEYESILQTASENNKLLNSWRITPHEYNSDFTVTWECDGVEIQCAQEDLNKFEEKHSFDAEEIISELVEQMNKDARVAAFDRAKIDPDSL